MNWLTEMGRTKAIQNIYIRSNQKYKIDLDLNESYRKSETKIERKKKDKTRDEPSNPLD